MGYLFAIGSAVLYGTMPFLAKEIFACGGTELTVVALRFLFAVPIVFLIVRIMKIPLKITSVEFGKLFLLAQGYVLTNILLCFSYNYISSGMATTIHFIYPALVFFIHVSIFSEKFDRIKLICAVLGLAGVFCFYTPGEAASGVGMILAFCSAWTYAFYIIFDEKSGMALMNPYKLCFYISVICGLEASFFAVLRDEFVTKLPFKAWGFVIILALGVTVLAIVLAQESLKRIGAEKISFLSTFEPMTSLVLGIALMGETLNFRTVIGITCVLTSAVLIVMGKANGKRHEQAVGGKGGKS